MIDLWLLAAHLATTTPSCHNFSPHKIDYHDADVHNATSITSEAACCALCATWNAAKRRTALDNCTIAVWHGGHFNTCNLKATAAQPFASTAVVALQGVPPPPPPPPVRFASIYSSSMVLQSAPSIATIWGFTTSPTAKVTITIDGALGHRTSIVDHNGTYIWSTTASAPISMPAGFASHNVTVSRFVEETGEQYEETLVDVVFGDVFVCSGQSNMEYGINGSNGGMIKHPPVNDSKVEIESLRRYDAIRFFRAGHQQSSMPMYEVLPPKAGGSGYGSVHGWSRPCLEINGVSTCRSDFSAMCFFFGRNIYTALKRLGRGRPIGLIEDAWSGSEDEPWSSKDALEACQPPGTVMKDGAFWNGMIRPLLNTTIKGVIWYQGESDASHPGGHQDSGYNCTFPALIRDWRVKWAQGSGTSPTFPFGFVQLNSIGNLTVYNNPSDPADNEDGYSAAFGYAGLRWSQTDGIGYAPNKHVSGFENVFMAVAVDTPDRPVTTHYDPYPNGPKVHRPFDVHSPFKQPTAARLSRAALPLIYGVEVDTVGPRVKSVAYTYGESSDEATALTITLDDVGSKGLLPVRAGGQGFEVLTGGRWMRVPGSDIRVALGGAAVTIVPAPKGSKLRYNWYSNPCGEGVFGCAIYVGVEPIGELSGMESFLPLAPFQVDLK